MAACSHGGVVVEGQRPSASRKTEMTDGLEETGTRVRLSEVLSALSFILDRVEGQPEGHAVRSCFIGMSVAERLGLSEERRSALFYALLLKDAWCSSKASRVAVLLDADDSGAKSALKMVVRDRLPEAVSYLARHVGRDRPRCGPGSGGSFWCSYGVGGRRAGSSGCLRNESGTGLCPECVEVLEGLVSEGRLR
jgi:hypothetical protein